MHPKGLIVHPRVRGHQRSRAILGGGVDGSRGMVVELHSHIVYPSLSAHSMCILYMCVWLLYRFGISWSTNYPAIQVQYHFFFRENYLISSWLLSIWHGIWIPIAPLAPSVQHRIQYQVSLRHDEWMAWIPSGKRGNGKSMNISQLYMILGLYKLSNYGVFLTFSTFDCRRVSQRDRHFFAKVQGIAAPIEGSWFAHIPCLAAGGAWLRKGSEKLQGKHRYPRVMTNIAIENGHL